ncbi:YjdF family protein [Bombilactobacillus thymidiniphilus]|uniref:YjdF family protein n=1 Tax=Bombilactobacillus thymidiniphilus TaxID=2923363 RepID=A0ABY4PEW1_9LACO|nr:YjdF family protein [Bombilactobacillus thymidiniphilus]UQS84175.1 YjdF family protein [Bombilactobacillus thymidiniphilus]
MCGIMTMTIVFDDPFYKAIIENRAGGVYSVASYVFGTSRPKNVDIYNIVFSFDFWDKLSFFEDKDDDDYIKTSKHINPKRLQRQAKKQVNSLFSGTKAQQELNKQRESNKLLNKKHNSRKTQEYKARQFQLKQEKKLQKHKGH